MINNISITYMSKPDYPIKNWRETLKSYIHGVPKMILKINTTL